MQGTFHVRDLLLKNIYLVSIIAYQQIAKLFINIICLKKASS